MKSFRSAAAVVCLAAGFARATPPLPTPKVTFAHCFGDHHGTDLAFVRENGEVYVETSNDSGEPAVPYRIHRLTKAYAATDPSTYASAIGDAIRAQGSGSMGASTVFLQASAAGGSQLFVELNKWNGKSFVVVDGHAEELTCPVEHVRD
ncbi:MAG: hypothetical protein HY059_09880 [Proteobacteria bacterium]|nr:hypothetical protein [Pseudomonadota bacterium]